MSTEKKEKDKPNNILNKNDQKKFEALTKILNIITKIVSVFIIIAIVFFAILMVATPVIMKNISVEGNNITIFDEKYEFSINADENSIDIYKPTDLDHREKFKDEESHLYRHIIESLNEENVAKTFAFVEIELIGTIVVLVIYYYTLLFVKQLLTGILKERTPFTKESSMQIRKIAYFLIISYVVVFMVSLITELIFGYSSGFDLPFISIPAILGLFAVSYVFAYGYGLQKTSKAKMLEKE